MAHWLMTIFYWLVSGRHKEQQINMLFIRIYHFLGDSPD